MLDVALGVAEKDVLLYVVKWALDQIILLNAHRLACGWRRDHRAAWHKCFTEVVDKLVKVSSEQGYKDLKFTFDGRQGQGTTGLLYDSLTAQREWADALSFADEISFGNRKNPRIQIADLVARETMKGFLSSLADEKNREPFLLLAHSEYRIWFDFLMGDFFAGWRAALPALEKETGLGGHEYRAWIKKKKMQDNLNSRIRFMIWHDAKTLREKNKPESEKFDHAMKKILHADPGAVKAAVDAEIQANTVKREAKGERKRGRKPKITSASDRAS